MDTGLLQPTSEWCEVSDFLREWAGRKDRGEGRALVNMSLPRTPVYVRADTYLLNTALDNILDNAFRHAPAGTAIDVTAVVRDRQIAIRIEDRGPGIREEESEKIFERFYRGNSEPPGGLGLGLAVARQFMDLLGGTISAAPRPGGGASFTVSLPCTMEMPSPGKTTA
jgi:K+-sensing histidine kinase KdpD